MRLSALLLLAPALRNLCLAQEAPSFSSISAPAGGTVTYGNNTLTHTPLPPYAYATSYTWYQSITPTIVGTVFVVINNYGQTKTVTSSNTEVLASHSGLVQNGSLKLLTRTDVDEYGTVTAAIELYGNRSTVLTYPTPIYNVDPYVHWYGIFPTSFLGVSCCTGQAKSSPTPSHYPFATPTGTTDSEDPSGWLYALQESYTAYNGSQELSTFFAPASISSLTEHCPHQLCVPQSSAAAATAASEVGALLKTSTVHVTGSFSGSGNPTPKFSSASDSVEVDPVSHKSSTKATTGHHAAPTPSPKDSSTPAPAQPVHHHKTKTVHSTETPQSGSAALTPAGSSTVKFEPVSSETRTDSSRPAPPPIVFGKSTITPTKGDRYIIGSQTLRPDGPPITVSGTPYSLGWGATELVAGTVTALATKSPGGGGVGSYIWSGLGGTESESPSKSPLPGISATVSGVPAASSSYIPASATGAAAPLSIHWGGLLGSIAFMVMELVMR